MSFDHLEQAARRSAWFGLSSLPFAQRADGDIEQRSERKAARSCCGSLRNTGYGLKERFMVARSVQHAHHEDLVAIDAIENVVIAMHASTDILGLIAPDDRIA